MAPTHGWRESLLRPLALPLSTNLPDLLLGDWKFCLLQMRESVKNSFCRHASLPLGAGTTNLVLQGLTPFCSILVFTLFVSSPCSLQQPSPGITPEAAKCSTITRSSVSGSGECHAAEQGFRRLYYLQVEKQSLTRARSPPFLIREAGGAHSPLQPEGRGRIFTVTLQKPHLRGFTVSFCYKAKK